LSLGVGNRVTDTYSRGALSVSKGVRISAKRVVRQYEVELELDVVRLSRNRVTRVTAPPRRHSG
jgi:hypothetical protein